MPHIGIHRLASRYGEKHRAEHRESNARRRMNEIDQGAVGADCLQDRGSRNNTAHPKHGDNKKPQQHHRPEDVADKRGPFALD